MLVLFMHLSSFQITRIDGLDSLSSLQKLDLSYNKIESICKTSSVELIAFVHYLNIIL